MERYVVNFDGFFYLRSIQLIETGKNQMLKENIIEKSKCNGNK